MIGGLNKILDRNFVVGYAIPSVVLILLGRALLPLFGLVPDFLKLDGAEPFKDTTLVALLVLSISILLMSLNWSILRFFEGYWRVELGGRVLDRTYKWNCHYVKRWRKLRDKIDGLTQERDDCLKQGKSFLNSSERQRVIAIAYFAERFPSEQHQVLPTKLGNAIRAFEDYPRVMYGIESISGWSRLNAVIPKEYRELMDQARADMCLWLNLLFIDLVLLTGYLVAALVKRKCPEALLVLPALVLLPFFLSAKTTSAAIGWGEWVKAAFDLFLPDLREKLGYSKPPGLKEDRELWMAFSQAITFRQREALENIAKYRERHSEAEGIIPPSDFGGDA